jgi:hypothetical protein
MEINLSVDVDLVERARSLTKVTDMVELLIEASRSLVSRESAKCLALLVASPIFGPRLGASLLLCD